MDIAADTVAAKREARGPRLARDLAGGAGLALVAVAIRATLHPVLETTAPFFFQFLAVFLAARFLGFGPAAVALLLSLVANACFFDPPPTSFAIGPLQRGFGLAVQAIVGTTIAWFVTRRTLRLEQLHGEIAERKRAESALRESRDQLRRSREDFRALTEKAPVGIFRTDSTGACTYVNEYWYRLCGTPPAETLGEGWAQPIHPDDRARVYAVWREALAAKRSYSVEYRLVPRGGGPVRHAITTAEAVRDDRDQFSHYVGTVIDVTDLQRATRDLEQQEGVLRNLIEAQEHEKQSICHDIHDGLLQYAVGSRMLLEAWQRGHGGDDEADVIETVVGYLARGIDEGRQVIRGVRPNVLDDLGLEAAIGDLAEQFRCGGMEVDVHVDSDAALASLRPSLQMTIYRVVQESLNNARKHSGSPRAAVTILRGDDRLRLVVRDAGCGFDPESARQRGFGMVGMIERVRLAGGRCTIESVPEDGRTTAAGTEAGTTVTADLPFDAVPAAGSPASGQESWAGSAGVAGTGADETGDAAARDVTGGEAAGDASFAADREHAPSTAAPPIRSP